PATSAPPGLLRPGAARAAGAYHTGAGSAGAGDVGCDDLPAADGVGPGVLLGRGGAAVDHGQAETDLVPGLAQLGGPLAARAAVSGHELLVGLAGRHGRADQRPCLGVLV